MIAFRDRLNFRVYNPGKSDKYGVKIYKLGTPTGFVWNFLRHCGNDPSIESLNKSGSVVVILGEKMLNEGRLFMIYWYTSVPLVLYLKEIKTHVYGTLRKNRKYLPKDVVQ